MWPATAALGKSWGFAADESLSKMLESARLLNGAGTGTEWYWHKALLVLSPLAQCCRRSVFMVLCTACSHVVKKKQRKQEKKIVSSC